MDQRSYFLQILNKSVVLDQRSYFSQVLKQCPLKAYERMFAQAWAFAQSALLIFLEGVYIVMSHLSYVCGTGILEPYLRN